MVVLHIRHLLCVSPEVDHSSNLAVYKGPEIPLATEGCYPAILPTTLFLTVLPQPPF